VDITVLILVYVVIGCWSTGYAFLLQWAERSRGLVTEFTWATVVVGVAMVLAWLLIVVPPVWLAVVFGGFAVSGLPMIVRCLWNDHRNRVEAERHGDATKEMA
jgi:hypothetical protein